MLVARRSFLQGLGATLLAPAICRAENLMPIKEYMPEVPVWCPDGWLPLDGREIKRKFYPDLFAAYDRMRLSKTLQNQQEYVSLAGLSPPRLQIGVRAPAAQIERRIVSYRDLLRPNGTVMRAGAGHTIVVPEGV